MGNDIMKQKMDLQFIQLLDDQRFGQIQIYKSQDAKFIMKNTKTFVSNDKRYHDFQLQLQLSNNLKQNRAIIPILHYQNKQMKNLCIDYQLIHIYTQYFNFTLQDLIRSAKDIDDSQLWLCLKQLTLLAQALSFHGFAAKFQIDNIFITLKGLPAIYPFFVPIKRIKQRNNQDNVNNDTQKQSSSNLLDDSVYELQQVFNNQNAMLKDIAEIILKLGTMDSNITVILIQKFRIKHPKLTRVIQELLNTAQIKCSDVLDLITFQTTNKSIKISNQIKLNKFRYMIPPINSNIDENKNQSKKTTDQLIKEKSQALKNHFQTFKIKENSEKFKQGLKHTDYDYKNQSIYKEKNQKINKQPSYKYQQSTEKNKQQSTTRSSAPVIKNLNPNKNKSARNGRQNYANTQKKQQKASNARFNTQTQQQSLKKTIPLSENLTMQTQQSAKNSRFKQKFSGLNDLDQIQRKKQLYQQQRLKLEQRKKMLKQESSSNMINSSSNSTDKGLNRKQTKQNKYNLSLKSSKVTNNFGTSWTKKVITSHFTDIPNITKDLRIRR